MSTAAARGLDYCAQPLDAHLVPTRLATSDQLHELIRRQEGVVSRSQLVEHGMTDEHIAAHLAGNRWQRARPGAYLTFTGPASFRTQVWAALLYAGDGAVATGETAAFLSGLRDQPPPYVEISVDARRRVRNDPGCNGGPALRIRRVRDLQQRRHPGRLLPQTRIEDTVLDLVDQAADTDRVVGLITGACQRRLTTAARIEQRAAERSRLRWRALVGEVLEDVLDGVQSPLERRWRRDVERAHGLPVGKRNHREGVRGSHRYRDVRYVNYHIVIELDGNAAHPIENRDIDRARDNDVAAGGDITLRYGWRAVAGAPCETADEVARVLTSQGWAGKVRRCAPGCGPP